MIESEHRPTQIRVRCDCGKFRASNDQLAPKTEAFAVVKANAYGHGAVAVAKKLSSQAAGFVFRIWMKH